MRSFIRDNVGSIEKINKLGSDSLKSIENKGGLVGVDGSVNTEGGAYPHFVQVFQGLAKSTLKTKAPIFQADLYSPLIMESGDSILENGQDARGETKDKLLSDIEIKVALKSIDDHKPYAIMMDGSLIRYFIYSKDLWLELREKCEENGIILIGLIKDIKTSVIGDSLKSAYQDMDINAYDREVLFGLLDYGEGIFIKNQVSKKYESGYSSAFIRSSLAPSVVGLDILDSQKAYIKEMASLVLSLTPENSRGVPLWLDLVDKEVKISDNIMKGLMENFLDRDIYERFFVSERAKRN